MPIFFFSTWGFDGQLGYPAQHKACTIIAEETLQQLQGWNKQRGDWHVGSWQSNHAEVMRPACEAVLNIAHGHSTWDMIVTVLPGVQIVIRKSEKCVLGMVKGTSKGLRFDSRQTIGSLTNFK